MNWGVAAAALLMLLLATPAAPARAADFKVVAHPSVPTAQIKRQDLAAIFLTQANRWSNGQSIAPVDQSTQSSVRAAFSQEVLGQPVAAVQRQWMQRIAARKGWPPSVKASDTEVLAFVAATPGAIGYVSPATPTDGGVREIQLD